MNKKSIVAIAIIILFAPQVTFAAWWNPLTWRAPQVKNLNVAQKEKEKTVEMNEPAKVQSDNKPSPLITPKITAKSIVKPKAHALKKVVQEVKREVPKVFLPDPPPLQLPQVVQPVQSQTPPAPSCNTGFICGGKCWTACSNNQTWQCINEVGTCGCSVNTLLCNDQCWSQCPSGQQFSCTTNGAVCTNPRVDQQPTNIVQIIPQQNQEDSVFKIAKCQAQAQAIKNNFLLAGQQMEKKSVDDMNADVNKQIASLANRLGSLRSEEVNLLSPSQQIEILRGRDSSIYQQINGLKAWQAQRAQKIHEDIFGLLLPKAEQDYNTSYQDCLKK